MHDEGGQKRHSILTDELFQNFEQCLLGKRRFTVSELSEEFPQNFEKYFVWNCHRQTGLP
jgi:hypothetical protein